MQPERFSPFQALALNLRQPGLWRAANHTLLNSLRAGVEHDSARPSRSTAAAQADRPSLFQDLPALVLAKILQQLDRISLISVAQTCRHAHNLSSKFVDC